MYLVFKRTVKDQRRTKDKPRNDLRTPNHPKVRFIKIAVSFPSLIPCLSSPTDDRENSDRTPTPLPANKKCRFLRLLPNKVVLIPKIVAYPPNKKIAPKLHFSCTIQNNSLPLQSKPKQPSQPCQEHD